jgi:hypothetical protein
MTEDEKLIDEEMIERDQQDAENYRKVASDIVEWMEGPTNPNMPPRSDCG